MSSRVKYLSSLGGCESWGWDGADIRSKFTVSVWTLACLSPPRYWTIAMNLVVVLRPGSTLIL